MPTFELLRTSLRSSLQNTVVGQSDLHFFQTQKYVQFFKQINIVYIITHKESERKK